MDRSGTRTWGFHEVMSKRRGITIAQKLDTAEQSDMPESAIASGCVDFALAPEEILHGKSCGLRKRSQSWGDMQGTACSGAGDKVVCVRGKPHPDVAIYDIGSGLV